MDGFPGLYMNLRIGLFMTKLPKYVSFPERSDYVRKHRRKIDKKYRLYYCDKFLGFQSDNISIDQGLFLDEKGQHWFWNIFELEDHWIFHYD